MIYGAMDKLLLCGLNWRNMGEIVIDFGTAISKADTLIIGERFVLRFEELTNFLRLPMSDDLSKMRLNRLNV
jgi:hypothetical protein